MADMKWKVGYGAKDDVAPAIEEQTLDSGDFIITSDTEEMGFVKPDGTAMYIKSRPEIFISLSQAQEYMASGAGTVYAGQIIIAKLEDEKYHTYTVQPSDGGYVLEEIGNTSSNDDLKNIVDDPLNGNENLFSRLSGPRTLTTLKALFESSQTGISFFSSSSGSEDIPSQTTLWQYGTGIILKRDSNNATVILFGHNSGAFAINYTANGGNTWGGWQTKS